MNTGPLPTLLTDKHVEICPVGALVNLTSWQHDKDDEGNYGDTNNNVSSGDSGSKMAQVIVGPEERLREVAMDAPSIELLYQRRHIYCWWFKREKDG